MNIVGFAASNNKRSINKQLLTYAINQLENTQEHRIKTLDIHQFEMPIYSIDRQLEEGFPVLSQEFYNEIKEADALVITLAEHNLNFSTAFKNILDWVSRIDMNFLEGKNLLVFSTSPGAYGGGNVMEIGLKYFAFAKGNIVDYYSLPSFQDHFSNGQFTDENQKAIVDEKIKAFHESLVTSV